MISTPRDGAAIAAAIDGAASVVVAASGELHPARGPFVEALRHGVAPAQLHPETGRVQRLSKKIERAGCFNRAGNNSRREVKQQ